MVERVRRRLERGETLQTSVTLTNATPAQRAAAHSLLGRRPRPGTTLTVSLTAVDDVLRRSGASPDGLTAAVITLTGPIVNRAAHTASLDAAWQRAFAPVAAVVNTRPNLTDWYERLHANGLVRRLAATPADAEPLLADLASVLESLPADGEHLGRFAARTARRAHALDDGEPLATLALSAARAIADLPESPSREAWAAVGVLRDEVSTTVLTLGLPGDPHTTTGQALAAWHPAGQPVVLTLRQLVRDPPRLTGQLISICENPIVISTAADRLGPTSTPLICTNGQPGAAVMLLLRSLLAAGADLRYHGDFDWGGLRIANLLFSRLPVRHWHFDAAAYRTAAAAHPGHPLTGTPATADWDPDLGPAMTETGTKVEEELVLDDLIADLRNDHNSRAQRQAIKSRPRDASGGTSG
ncbi:TIGR02679 family protein [Amycolatopsis sp. H20-H5]|uniref:TIGR02679 family protein n=1 Tax=Amycolatopsis sp. H20-H5 TaxID=3046309 RepID=UPI002DBC1408|nr:TIGR02679 family protein [Amycolatopsis sp. H20-H5]MEC3982786.1 TIGR02679 family protein [Amycolatopsis sp. H20-H5]